jgi:hypothetical protein
MKYFLLFAVALLAILGVGISAGVCTVNEAAICFATLTLGTFAVTDAELRVSRALPTGASAVTATGIDLGHGTTGRNVADFELLLTAPALAVGQLANTSTMTYAIVTSANSDMSSPTVINSAALVQTGAGGVGAAGNTLRFRLPTNCQRYVSVRATNSAAADASAASYTLELKF